MERYLEFRNWKTRERGMRVNVTGRSERSIERVERGMLYNIGENWYVYDSLDDAAEDSTGSSEPVGTKLNVC